MNLCQSTQQGTTIIDLSANPDNASPAITHLVTTIQDARAADQKVIVMLGESHDTVLQVAFAILLRCGLQKAVSKDRLVLALEERHNSLEYFLPHFFMAEPLSFDDAACYALQNLKQDSSEHYRCLQAQAVASCSWPQTPVTRLESVSGWLCQKLPVRLIDMSMTMCEQIDINNPETAKFIKTHPAEGDSSLNGGDSSGMRLRNLWMMAGMREIIKDHDVVLLQTGLAHLGGTEEDGNLYEHSLHGLGVQTEHDVRVITVFPEHKNITFKNMLSAEAQQAMNNPDTIICRGGNEESGDFSSINEEAATLRRIFKASGLPDNELSINNVHDYKRKIEEHKTTLREELDRVIATYTNAP